MINGLDLKVFDREMTQWGYDPKRYAVDLDIKSEFNQVIIVRDLQNNVACTAPVEENVLDWSAEKLAAVVADAIKLADSQL